MFTYLPVSIFMFQESLQIFLPNNCMLVISLVTYELIWGFLMIYFQLTPFLSSQFYFIVLCICFSANATLF